MRRARGRRRLYAIEVTHWQIEVPRLPVAFTGLRLAQLSDIHHGLYMPLEHVAAAVELANRLEPDLVALTGDFVSHSRKYIEPVAEVLGRLCAPLGVFAVLGNHDFRVGANRVVAALAHHGIEVLRNRHVRVARDSASLCVAGVDGVRDAEANLRQALQGVGTEATTFLLCHNPAILPCAAAYDIKLVLSGHTHGGQVGLGRLRRLAATRGLSLPFAHGWQEFNGTQLYISRGLGTVILPIRFRCPAEIPLLQFRPSSGSRRAQP
ncbi:MAG: metallophosphoesterase [Terriglobia bacterium]